MYKNKCFKLSLDPRAWLSWNSGDLNIWFFNFSFTSSDHWYYSMFWLDLSDKYTHVFYIVICWLVHSIIWISSFVAKIPFEPFFICLNCVWIVKMNTYFWTWVFNRKRIFLSDNNEVSKSTEENYVDLLTVEQKSEVYELAYPFIILHLWSSFEKRRTLAV